MSLIERYADKIRGVISCYDRIVIQGILPGFCFDEYAGLYCPVIKQLDITYYWSLMQVEYSTDVVFKRQADLGPVYETITRTAIHTVKPDKVATFLGRKLTGHYQDELGNNFSTRIEGTCIKHHMGPVAIKMYDKFGLVLRIETTVNDPSFGWNRKTDRRSLNWPISRSPSTASMIYAPC